jgi:hypothetical protein
MRFLKTFEEVLSMVSFMWFHVGDTTAFDCSIGPLNFQKCYENQKFVVYLWNEAVAACVAATGRVAMVFERRCGDRRNAEGDRRQRDVLRWFSKGGRRP